MTTRHNVKSISHNKSRFHRTTFFTITASAVVAVATTHTVEVNTNGAIPENLLLLETNDDPSNLLQLNATDDDAVTNDAKIQSKNQQQQPSTVVVQPQNSGIEEKKCRVYFAESTIPGAGCGLFAGVDIPQDEEISILGDALIDLRDLKEDSLLGTLCFLLSLFSFLLSVLLGQAK